MIAGLPIFILQLGQFEKWIFIEKIKIPINFKQADKKADLSGPNKILIDDREDTIMNWKHKNGIGILYTSTEQAINELKQLGI